MSIREIIRYIWDNLDEIILIWPYYILLVFAVVLGIFCQLRLH